MSLSTPRHPFVPRAPLDDHGRAALDDLERRPAGDLGPLMHWPRCSWGGALLALTSHHWSALPRLARDRGVGAS